MQKSEFKKVVRNKVEKQAFSQLISKQKHGTKGGEIKYDEKKEMADFFLPNKIIKLEERRDIFKICSRTNKLPSNWGEHSLCETRCLELLDNEHILKCSIFNENETFYLN